MPAGARVRRLEWAAGAIDAYLSTLSRIAAEDPFTAREFAERVEQSLNAIARYPFIGTPAARRGERRHPVPGTGHIINYRITRTAIRVQLWYRGRRHMR